MNTIIEQARMNFTNSVAYLESIRQTPGHNHGSLIQIHQHVTTRGDVWVIAEREEFWFESGVRVSESRFYGTSVAKNVARASLAGTEKPHDMTTLGDEMYFRADGKRDGRFSHPYSSSLEDAQSRAEAIDMEKRVQFLIKNNEETRAYHENLRAGNAGPFEIQTWEWDAERECEKATYTTVSESLHSDPYGGAE